MCQTTVIGYRLSVISVYDVQIKVQQSKVRKNVCGILKSVEFLNRGWGQGVEIRKLKIKKSFFKKLAHFRPLFLGYFEKKCYL
jgi:PIN domain nuclease of toxin-antitoxin system